VGKKGGNISPAPGTPLLSARFAMLIPLVLSGFSLGLDLGGCDRNHTATDLNRPDAVATSADLRPE